MATINSAKYQGYLWMSDQTKPEVYLGDRPVPEFALKDGENPFVIEGNLYDKEAGISLSIKYVDGRYVIAKYDLIAMAEDKSMEVSDEIYLTNSRLISAAKCPEECAKSIYKRIWKEESDGQWLELKPYGFAFAGFCKEHTVKKED